MFHATGHTGRISGSEGSRSLGLLPVLLSEGVGVGESSALGVSGRGSRESGLPESP